MLRGGDMKRFSLFKKKKDSSRQATAELTPPVGDAEPVAPATAPDTPSGADTAEGPRRRFGFLDAKRQAVGAAESPAHAQPPLSGATHGARTNRGLLPGSDGEHELQCRYGAAERANGFYTRQVLDYLSPAMQTFIAEQEFLFVATADRHGECDCTSKFGQPGFIRVLGEKYLMYPEYRGNGVFANLGNLTENPHIALLIIDFCHDTVGLHVNGRARIVENEE